MELLVGVGQGPVGVADQNQQAAVGRPDGEQRQAAGNRRGGDRAVELDDAQVLAERLLVGVEAGDGGEAGAVG